MEYDSVNQSNFLRALNQLFLIFFTVSEVSLEMLIYLSSKMQ